MGIKFHYLDATFSMHTKTVAFRHFGERHTAINITAAFQEVLAQYNIQLPTFGCQVTDNACNMVKAFELFSLHAQLASDAEVVHSSRNTSDTTADQSDDESADGSLLQEDSEYSSELLELLSRDSVDPISENQSDTSCIDVGVRLPCLAHTLQLAMKDGTKQILLVDKILKESNVVVVFFHRSLYWGNQLKKLTGGKTLLCALVTRWNSNLTMLRRLSQDDVWKCVGDVLAHTRAAGGTSNIPRFTVSRQQILDFVSLLSPFEEATNALQGDGITIFSVIPALLGIDDMIASCNYEQFTGKRLRQALHDRYQHVITTDEYVLVTVLDCRYE